MTNLITAAEVVKYGPVDRNYPTEALCTHIPRVELLEFSKCYMGIEFYDKLRDDLVDISSAKGFVEGTYNTGDMIVYKSLVYESTIDGQTVNPQDSLANWTLTKKFTTPKYNDLWDNGLKNWLAYAVIYTSIRYNTYKAGSKGLVKTTGDDTGIATVNEREFSSFKSELLNDVEQWLKVIYDYMVRITNDKDTTVTYSNIEEISNACGTCVKPSLRTRSRRIHFKR